MKILREDNEPIIKEALPTSFLTDMMSKGWEEVGYLKEASAAIKETYVNTAKVESMMQDLMDTYKILKPYRQESGLYQISQNGCTFLLKKVRALSMVTTRQRISFSDQTR